MKTFIEAACGDSQRYLKKVKENTAGFIIIRRNNHSTFFDDVNNLETDGKFSYIIFAS